MDKKEKTIKALAACSEFYCDECPYQYLDHREYSLRCIHTLIKDLHELFKEEKLDMFGVGKQDYATPPTKACIECKDWMHTRLWIGYKFCPYCGRKLDEMKTNA